MSNQNIGAGIAFPLSVDQRGQIALVRGDSEVEQAIAIILSTAPGERPMRPDFGCEIHNLLFEVIDAATVGKMETAIRRALDRWEPRIEIVDIDFDLSARAEGCVNVDLTYELRDVPGIRNLVYPFYVIPEEDEGTALPAPEEFVTGEVVTP